MDSVFSSRESFARSSMAGRHMWLFNRKRLIATFGSTSGVQRLSELFVRQLLEQLAHLKHEARQDRVTGDSFGFVEGRWVVAPVGRVDVYGANLRIDDPDEPSSGVEVVVPLLFHFLGRVAF